MIENERQTEQSADGREFSELALGGFSKLVAATEAYVAHVEHAPEAFEVKNGVVFVGRGGRIVRDQPATMTQRLVGGESASFAGETIVIGALDSYEARCRGWYRPGTSAVLRAATASR